MISNRYEKYYIQFQNGTEGAGKFVGTFTLLMIYFLSVWLYTSGLVDLRTIELQKSGYLH